MHKTVLTHARRLQRRLSCVLSQPQPEHCPVFLVSAVNCTHCPVPPFGQEFKKAIAGLSSDEVWLVVAPTVRQARSSSDKPGRGVPWRALLRQALSPFHPATVTLRSGGFVIQVLFFLRSSRSWGRLRSCSVVRPDSRPLDNNMRMISSRRSGMQKSGVMPAHSRAVFLPAHHALHGGYVFLRVWRRARGRYVFHAGLPAAVKHGNGLECPGGVP
jgi:hypothetical protein